MPLIVKKNAAEYEPTPTGLQQAVCVFVEDMGYEPNMNQKMARKCVLLWELKELMKNGMPFMISKSYTLSLNEKANLRKDLEAWRGKVFAPEELEGFDLEKLKGANCMLNVMEYPKANGDMGTKVTNVMALPKGTERLIPVNTKLPEWVGERKKKNAVNAPEAESATLAEEPVHVPGADEPPF